MFLLSPEPAVSLCTQFWVPLPMARGQWAGDTAAAVTPGSALLQPPGPLFVSVSPIHVCTSVPMSICGSVCAHGKSLPGDIPSQASIGTGRVSATQPWYSSTVHPQALGQASCPWLPACGGCPSSAHPLWGVPASLFMQASRAARHGTTAFAGQHLCLSQAVQVLLHISAHQLVGKHLSG